MFSEVVSSSPPWVLNLISSMILITTLVIVLVLILQPRKGGDNAPPMVTESIVKVPFFGRAIEFGKSPMKMLKRCYDMYGPVYTIPILNQRLTILLGPEAQEPFFRSPDEVLSPQECYKFMKPVFGPGVVYDASRKNRQVQFQSMSNGLRSSRMRSYVPKIEKETYEFLNNWGEEGEVDLFQALSELTILTATRCLHGDDVRETMFKEVATLFHDLDHGVTPLSVFFPNAPTKAHRLRNQARKKMVKLFSRIISERRANRGKTDGTDILSIFMDVKYKDGSKITDEQVTGLLIALLFAGQHTSCITSTWTTLFIVTNPHVLNKVLQEQNDVLGSEFDSGLMYDNVNQMSYLGDCMREALRLCPPLCLLMRKVLKEVSVTANGCSYIIPKGDTVVVSPSVSMRLASTFPDPDTFCPERYGPGREEHKIPYAYMGFGGGMHSCVGQAFGYLQVKSILSILIREYDIQMISNDFPECDYEAMVVGPKGDCRVRYKKKRNTSRL